MAIDYYLTKRWNQLKQYWQAEYAAAGRAEYGVGNVFDFHAFLYRYGNADAIRRDVQAVEELRNKWPCGYMSERDVAVLNALNLVLGRLNHLFDTANAIEEELTFRGYRFDPATRTLKAVSGRRGPPRWIGSEEVANVFEQLTEKEQPNPLPRKNTVEVRHAIRQRLADLFHPELITDQKVEAIVNRILNP